MGKVVKAKRRYFTKAQKISILNELNIKGVSLSELARKYQINSVVLYRWRKRMDMNIKGSAASSSDYQSIITELEKTKQENEHLKKALGELAIEKQILKTANEVLKKRQIRELSIPRRKLLKK